MDTRVRKYVAECIGSFVLVFVSCGSYYFIDDFFMFGVGVPGVAMAIGLAYAVMHMVLRPVSGGHMNPAVTLGVWIQRGMDAADLLFYVLAQCVGSFFAVFSLGAILGANFEIGGVNDITNLPNEGAGFAAEVVLGFVLVLVVLRTLRQKNDGLAGLLCGAAVTVLHLVDINMTGISVNPARSLATAVYGGDPDAMLSLWVFLIAPLVGALLAALAEKFLRPAEGMEKR